MPKKLDGKITTLQDFRFATEALSDDVQLYVQTITASGDWGALIEVTGLHLNLAKSKDHKEFLVLRSV